LGVGKNIPIFFLTSSIEDVEKGDFFINDTLFTVWIFKILASSFVWNLVGFDSPSIVGSYSSTKWLWMNWIVRADFPTPASNYSNISNRTVEKRHKPPPPTTTSLYSLKNWA
jgi:hypothetical protein